MKKVVLIVLFFVMGLSLFASNSKHSLSTNVSIFATSLAYEYKLNNDTQISIPVGISLIDYYDEGTPPTYIGLLAEHSLNEFIPGETEILLKVGYGLANIFNSGDLLEDDDLNYVLTPMLTAQLEMFVSKNHSLYFRTTPLLGMLYYKDGIKFSLLESANVYEYFQFFEATAFATLSFGYRYTFN